VPFSGLRTQYGISRSTGNRLIAASLIDARKLGRRVLINTHSVRQHLNRLPRPAISERTRTLHAAIKADYANR
jgi:hypothetical protein